MLKHKAAHGSGSNIELPDAREIQRSMAGYPEHYKVEICGDGSYTAPTIWWAALGGFGIWMPTWASPSEVTNNDQTGPPQQHEQQTPLLPHLEQRSSSSCDQARRGANTTRDGDREGFFLVPSAAAWGIRSPSVFAAATSDMCNPKGGI